MKYHFVNRSKRPAPVRVSRYGISHTMHFQIINGGLYTRWLTIFPRVQIVHTGPKMDPWTVAVDYLGNQLPDGHSFRWKMNPHNRPQFVSLDSDTFADYACEQYQNDENEHWGMPTLEDDAN